MISLAPAALLDIAVLGLIVAVATKFLKVPVRRLIARFDDEMKMALVQLFVFLESYAVVCLALVKTHQWSSFATLVDAFQPSFDVFLVATGVYHVISNWGTSVSVDRVERAGGFSPAAPIVWTVTNPSAPVSVTPDSQESSQEQESTP